MYKESTFQQKNIMRTLHINSLPSEETWIDKDTVMLHACLQILHLLKNGHRQYIVYKQIIKFVFM